MSGIVFTPQGTSLPFEFDRGGESIDGWICTIEVKQYPDDTAAPSRVITPTGCSWVGFLTEAETLALSVGGHVLNAILTNATTGEEEQITRRIHISRNWG